MNSSENNTSWPPSFSLDQESILKLLTGDRFYSNASAALRESILNAIDAIHRRKLKEPNLTPEIRVIFDEEALTLTVSDNGIGMSQEAVSDLFTRIGASASALEENPSSVGEFGIGVISYFMAGDCFSVHTFDGDGSPIGLSFSKAMLAGGTAESTKTARDKRGTTIEIAIRDKNTFSLLKENFPHWCRDVEGLSASLQPDGTPLNQGLSERADNCIELPVPPWVEATHLSPVSQPKGWDAMSGESSISVLYRGIFVQRFTVRGPWGIEGSIDVDPKHFEPRLNRESFVDGEFKSQVEQFLRDVHPIILEAMSARISKFLNDGTLVSWNVRRWATLWLSIPRDNTYASAAKAWDEKFRQIPAFEHAVGNKWEPISLQQLINLESPVYVAPHPDDRSKNEVVNAALRFLRHTGNNIVRGLSRDRAWLKYAGNTFATTADLITSVFSDELPELVQLAQNAESVLSNLAAVANLYSGQPSVDLVRYGADGPPVLRLQKRLIINIDNQSGKAIVNEALNKNKGRWSLIEITARHSYEHLTQVAAAVKDAPQEQDILGLVKRRSIRELLG